jgi:hypothetical protein
LAKLYLITEYLSKVPEKKRALLQERGIADLTQAVWADQVSELVRVLVKAVWRRRKLLNAPVAKLVAVLTIHIKTWMQAQAQAKVAWKRQKFSSIAADYLFNKLHI